jgi:hypothetical protein
MPQAIKSLAFSGFPQHNIPDIIETWITWYHKFLFIYLFIYFTVMLQCEFLKRDLSLSHHGNYRW